MILVLNLPMMQWLWDGHGAGLSNCGNMYMFEHSIFVLDTQGGEREREKMKTNDIKLKHWLVRVFFV